jgi:WD40 repeat protein
MLVVVLTGAVKSDEPKRQEPLTLKHGSAVFSVCWSPDGKRLASGGFDKTMKVWQADTGKELVARMHPQAVVSVCWSPDGRRLATAGYEGKIRVWSADQVKEILSVKHSDYPATGVAWSPDSKRLATASYDRVVKLWDAGNGQEVRTLKGHAAEVTSVSWSADGKRLASADYAKLAKVWDTENGTEIFTLKGHTDVVACLCWSPDRKRLATASWDKTVKVWDAEKGQGVFTLRGHTGLVGAVVWSCDGKRLATASADKTVKVWDAEKGQERLTLKGHTDVVNSVCWSSNGERLASASKDGTVGRCAQAVTGVPKNTGRFQLRRKKGRARFPNESVHDGGPRCWFLSVSCSPGAAARDHWVTPLGGIFMKYVLVAGFLLCSSLVAAPPAQMSAPTVLGPKAFRNGDVVEITDVRATSPKLEPGDSVTVRGRVRLASQDQARLCLYLTQTESGGSAETDPSQEVQVKRGLGQFELKARSSTGAFCTWDWP